MSKKARLLYLATFISIITGFRFIWGSDESADKAFYVGLTVYLFLVACALFIDNKNWWDHSGCRIFAAGAANFAMDWIFFNPYEPGVNEYILLIGVIFTERYLYKRANKPSKETDRSASWKDF